MTTVGCHVNRQAHLSSWIESILHICTYRQTYTRTDQFGITFSVFHSLSFFLCFCSENTCVSRHCNSAPAAELGQTEPVSQSLCSANETVISAYS